MVARLLVVLALLAGLSGPATAYQPDEVLDDPALEARARELSTELRCLVCQNQSIDDSDAPLARDLRVLIRERLQEGDTDGEVIDFVVARYGEFVLLRPRFAPHTWLLWLTPFAVLAIGGIVILRRRGARNGANRPDAPLAPAEEARLKDLIGDPDKGDGQT
ncbi:cytochrome c-type biogenesis protein CcmH [Kaustia mangrovi]|uniref:Cytochrome c-type biogenesis protein n=1 Tax=Kaustia mangrovi TaxID=2593653 RepID=A0A7S8HAZ0_9HYPH|nr:cytochrome c-type biogenesis protein [Kaustia mangrovi]QPC41971.1 cytochrome c-type biogenesis protein CcmH [Kaustia mangrovi]